MSYTYECNWAGAAAIAAAAATVNEHIFQLFPFCPQIHSVFCSFTLHLPFSISPIALHLSVSFSPPLQNFWICSELSFNDQNRQTATPLNCYMNKVALFNETYMRLIVCGLLSSTNWIRITCYFFPSCKPRKKKSDECWSVCFELILLLLLCDACHRVEGAQPHETHTQRLAVTARHSGKLYMIQLNAFAALFMTANWILFNTTARCRKNNSNHLVG